MRRLFPFAPFVATWGVVYLMCDGKTYIASAATTSSAAWGSRPQLFNLLSLVFEGDEQLHAVQSILACPEKSAAQDRRMTHVGSVGQADRTPASAVLCTQDHRVSE